MHWKQFPIVAFDTETTGLEPFAGDRIIEFAAVIFHLNEDGSVREREDHSFLVNPEIPIPRKITEITGLRDSDVAGKPLFAEIADDIQKLFHNAITVAHNYPFDRSFLNVEYQRLKKHWPEPIAQIDTVDLSMQKFRETRGHRLADLCARLNITLEGAHRATNDAAACGMCFLELAKRHNVGDDLEELLDWARAIGLPPDSSPIGRDESGRLVFLEGPHTGDTIQDHPLYLAWMEKSKIRGPQGWTFQYPESTRQWIRKWLDVRCSGRANPNPKSFRPEDWAQDSCITLHQVDPS